MNTKPTIPKPASPRCCGQDFRDYHYRPCPHNGPVERDGKHYCRRHDPVAVAARHKKLREKWAAQEAVDAVRRADAAKAQARAAECVAACRDLAEPEKAIAALREALESILASAAPNPRDNPAMFAAWKQARAALALLSPKADTTKP